MSSDRMRRATDRTLPNAVRADLDSVRFEMAKCRTEPNESIVALAKLAVQRSGLKLEYLGGLVGKSKGYISDALNEKEKFDMAWLDSWPEVLTEFSSLLKQRGNSPEAQKAHRRKVLLMALDLLLDEAVGQ